MMHITDGQLRAYYDHELGDLELARIEAHLSACAACQQEAQGVLGRAERVSSYFAALDLPAEPLPSRKRAHAKLRARLSETQK
ncbi:MAG: anti-sigma factor family protein, partial [Ardenticatenaceae bacterium]